MCKTVKSQKFILQNYYKVNKKSNVKLNKKLCLLFLKNKQKKKFKSKYNGVLLFYSMYSPKPALHTSLKLICSIPLMSYKV